MAFVVQQDVAATPVRVSITRSVNLYTAAALPFISRAAGWIFPGVATSSVRPTTGQLWPRWKS